MQIDAQLKAEQLARYQRDNDELRARLTAQSRLLASLGNPSEPIAPRASPSPPPHAGDTTPARSAARPGGAPAASLQKLLQQLERKLYERSLSAKALTLALTLTLTLPFVRQALHRGQRR